MKQVKKQYCQNCVNKRKPQFNFKISGLVISLCKNCWIGIVYGLKQDWEIFDRSESEFRQNLENTKKFEKEITK